MQRTLLLVLLLVGAGLTGCLGGQDEASNTGRQADQQGDRATVETANATLLSYPDADQVFGVEWANGSFTIDQSNQLLLPAQAAGQDPGHRHHIDVTDRVPAGQPVFIAAEINADVGGQGDVDIWLETSDTAVWTTDFDSPFGGYTRIEMILVRPASTSLTLVAQLDELPDRQEVPYTLSIDVRSHPELLLPGVPVTFPAGPGVSLELESIDTAAPIDALLFDPADTYLGRITGTDTAAFTLDEDADAGRYVAMLAEGIRPTSLQVTPAPGQELADPHLGLVEQTFTTGQSHALGTEGQVAWTFEADRVPLQVGVGVQDAGVAQDLEASLAGPAGQLLGITIEDGPWVQPGFFFLTPMGNPGLEVGGYEATVSFGAEAGGQAQAFHVLVHYQR